MASTKRDASREAFWRRIMAEFRKSGLTVREFCRRRKLHESAFYFWRRTLQERDGAVAGRPEERCDAARHSTQQCRPNRRGIQPPAFVPLVVESTSSAAGITLELRGGRALRLSESFPVERLAGLIRALEAEGRT
jgi:transposase-like protein